MSSFTPGHELGYSEDTLLPFCGHAQFPALPSSPPPGATPLFSISVIFSFQEGPANGILKDVTFWDWLSSLSEISWRFVQVMECIHSLIISEAEWNSTGGSNVVP